LHLFFRFFFSSRRRHTRFSRDWSSDVCSSDLTIPRTVSERVRSGYIALLAGFLAGRQHHYHLAAFELGHGLDQDQFAQIVAHSFEYAHTEFLVSHLAATKTQRDLCLVAILDETAQVAQFHLVVAFVGTRPELDFLDLDDLLAGTGFLLALLFLVLELAVVHQAADGGGGRGGDFDQIDVVLLGH